MNLYRNIIELSNMSNNDEKVLYTKEELPWDFNFSKEGYFDDPKLVLSRPVLQEEINAGLDTSWQGKNWNWENDPNFPEVPEITRALDDFFKLKANIEISNLMGQDLQSAINRAISSSFYDCMSGGSGKYFLSACRWFIENYDLNLNDEIYPSSDNKGSSPNGWYTFRDFLKEIEKLPRLEELLTSLPVLKKLLAEKGTF